MLLQALRDYQARQGTQSQGDDEGPPPEYEPRNIPWLVRIEPDGSSATAVRTAAGEGKRDPGKRYLAPFLKRQGTNIKPQLFADTAEMALGIANPRHPERSVLRHREFLTLAEACAANAPGQRAFGAAVRYLRDVLPNERAQLSEQILATENVQLAVDSALLVDLPEAQAFWEAVAPRIGAKGVLRTLTQENILTWLEGQESKPIGQCLVCGQIKPIERIHPVDIRVPRAVSEQRLKIVSADSDTFSSYGLERSLHAPTCRECARDYARGANALISGERSSKTLGSTQFFWWTREETGFDFNVVNQPTIDQVKALHNALHQGSYPPAILQAHFYECSLSASGSRAVVRDWIDTTLGHAAAAVTEWFQRQAVVGSWGEWPLWVPHVEPNSGSGATGTQTRTIEPLGLWGLAAAAVPRKRGQPVWESLPKTMVPALLRAAFKGTGLPPTFLQAAIRRCQSEQRVTRERAALIKLTLTFRQPYTYEEDTLVSLNQESRSPGYRCGRLLAVLERGQLRAIPKINQTVVGRFYGTASTAPRLVFPRLMQGWEAHRAKLQKGNNSERSAAFALTSRVDDIMEGLEVVQGKGPFPPMLGLDEQGLFALGYHHQRAADRAAALEAKRRRDAGEEASPDADLLDTSTPDDEQEA